MDLNRWRRPYLAGSAVKVWNVWTSETILPVQGKTVQEFLQATTHTDQEQDGFRLLHHDSCSNGFVITTPGGLALASYGYHGPNVFRAILDGKEVHPIGDASFEDWFRTLFGIPLPVNEAGIDVIAIEEFLSPGELTVEQCVLDRYGEKNTAILRAAVLDSPLTVQMGW